MTLDEQAEKVTKEYKDFLKLNDVKYGEIRIVVKDNQLFKLTVTKEKLLKN
jgi:hypothetical protein